MSYQITLRQKAKQDVLDITSWYQNQQVGLDIKFLQELEKALDKLTFMANSLPVLEEATRRILLNRFPYAVHFFIENQNVIVFAVMHGSRDPLLWQSRLDEN